ncbi:MAG: acylphosphatase [Candidatus Paceibacterota bacterium]|jgi:acylphosphatase
MKKHIDIKIHGRVQGVLFRVTSRIKARELNLHGWVRNEKDGTISMVAEGEDKDLRSFIEWCKYGPDTADVEKVDIDWREHTGEFNDFEIIR